MKCKRIFKVATCKYLKITKYSKYMKYLLDVFHTNTQIELIFLLI